MLTGLFWLWLPGTLSFQPAFSGIQLGAVKMSAENSVASLRWPLFPGHGRRHLHRVSSHRSSQPCLSGDMHNLLRLRACIFIKVLLQFFFFLRAVLAWWFECLRPFFASIMNCWAVLCWCSLWESSALLFEKRLLGWAALGHAAAAVGGLNLTSSEF